MKELQKQLAEMMRYKKTYEKTDKLSDRHKIVESAQKCTEIMLYDLADRKNCKYTLDEIQSARTLMADVAKDITEGKFFITGTDTIN